MARVLDKQKAIKLRLEGKSYSEIKGLLGISKSTLSGWLAPYPLSEAKIRELRDWSSRRIENFRITFRNKLEKRQNEAYENVKYKIKSVRGRELYISGFFLYWGEGSKTNRNSVALTNTNPAMLKFFIKWLTACFNVDKRRLKVALHLYSDMDIDIAKKYWSDELGLSLEQFGKPYIKKTLSSEITYKNGFGKGTCSVMLHCRDVAEPILMGVKYLQDHYNG
ncbi:MAG: helix-turn-helix domain containing protein [Candidatus Vogelbacteria bacterium]|nr:helix-turn-helix domain containing protein [Candidatus Vogelbacteria bacterium]